MKILRTAVAAAVLSLTFASTQAQAEVQTKVIEYKVGDDTFTGYMAWDDALGQKRPGVLVVHEWWGHDAFARRQALEMRSSMWLRLRRPGRAEGAAPVWSGALPAAAT